MCGVSPGVWIQQGGKEINIIRTVCAPATLIAKTEDENLAELQ